MLWWVCECVQNVPPHLQWVEAMRPEEAAFLRDLPFTLSVPSHRLLIVHAGLVPQRPKHRQHFLDMYQVPFLLHWVTLHVMKKLKCIIQKTNCRSCDNLQLPSVCAD